LTISLHGPRPPHEPGPGPIAEPLLRALDLTVGRRVHGLLAGDHRSAAFGRGTELAHVRPYRPGDDVRQIDWNATARLGEPYVRLQVAERTLTTWVLLDVSPSMTFGTADRRKADVAEGVVLAIAHLATRRANRLGLVAFGGDDDLVLPPRPGRSALLGVLLEARRRVTDAQVGRTSVADAARRTGGLGRGRALVFVVSDLRWEGGVDPALKELHLRHEIVAVEIADPRETSLPDVGYLALIDPETGERLEVDTSDRKLRRAFADAAAAERGAVAEALRRAAIDHVTLSTSGDWLRAFAEFLRRRERRR
jgi:uncharacterized protein (DUF58 family)